MPTKAKGTYLLILRADRFADIKVGSLASFGLEPKQYLYVGSAFGPGGLRARLAHHLKPTKKPRWHIDYLKQYAKIESILYSDCQDGLEHIWANKLNSSTIFSIPLRKFGASDCRCESHLFSAANSIGIEKIIDILKEGSKATIKVFEPQPKS